MPKKPDFTPYDPEDPREQSSYGYKPTKSAKIPTKNPKNPKLPNLSQIPTKNPIKPRRAGEPALRPQKGIHIHNDDIADLLQKYRGHMGLVADAIGCDRHTIYRRVKNDPILQQIYTDARERWIDDVEQSVLQRAVETGDTGIQCFVLKTQAKHRGWAQEDTLTTAKDLAKAAMEFVLNRSKNPAEYSNTPIQITDQPIPIQPK